MLALLLTAVAALPAALPYLAPSVQGENDPSVMFALDSDSHSLSELRNLLVSSGFDVLPESHSGAGPWIKCDGPLLVVATHRDRRTFAQLGLSITCEQEAVPFRTVAPPNGYDTPEDILAEFQALAAQYPGLAQLINLNEYLGTNLTVEGRSMYALKISDNVTLDDWSEYNVLLNANHHARELITPQLAQDAARRLLSGYASDQQIRRIVDANQIYIMFTCNPDGLAYVWDVDDYWRKNRVRNSGGSYGVDLNRNYPFGWDFSCGGSTAQSSDTYRGPSAGSERETQTMMAFHRDRHFAKVLDWHSYARDVRYNYADCADLPAAFGSYLIAQADAHRAPMNYALTPSCCTGGHISFAFHDMGALSHLSETGTAFQPPAEQMEAELVRVWPGTLWFLENTVPLTGFVQDASTGAPLSASITVTSYRWLNDESWQSHPESGRYTLWLPAGSHTVLVESDGYTPKSFAVTVASGSTTIQDFLL